jgi:hypothetical protein
MRMLNAVRPIGSVDSCTKTSPSHALMYTPILVQSLVRAFHGLRSNAIIMFSIVSHETRLPDTACVQSSHHSLTSFATTYTCIFVLSPRTNLNPNFSA